uniref:Glycosyltransferase n=1 Tax=Rubia yunnanensis TaxID=1650721 RepID=A0A896AQF1_9GENT|nr:anthraquinone glycosyltransferase [Rubia yunnanensis]
MGRQQLHIFFFPMLAHGHMLPILDMAKAFSSRAVTSTIITTHLHVPMFQKAIQNSVDISVRGITFPAAASGLPEGIESVEMVKSEEMFAKFFLGTTKLRGELENLLEELRPDCLVADMFFPWASDAAAKFDIPRLIFHGTSTFAMSVGESLRRNRPFDGVSSDSEPFIVPELPHEIKMTRGQVSLFDRKKHEVETEFSKLFKDVKASDSNCYGLINNSFYEMEPDYVEYYTKKLGRRTWHVGPLMLCNNDADGEKAERGKKSTIDEDDVIQWLDSKPQNSVVYVCFGSVSIMTRAQLQEIARGLESSGQDFIWVIRKCVDEEDSEKWFPKGFEDRIKANGKGLIVNGWAPQILILNHESVGAFVTHCGWNSTLESVSSGVPMITWPMFAEQFLNEKLLTDVLKIGVAVGATQWSRVSVEVLKGEKLAEAVARVMVGDEAVAIRARAKEMKDSARAAVEEGGSSFNDLDSLIRELSAYR